MPKPIIITTIGLFIFCNLSYCIYRINKYKKLVPINITVANDAKAFNSRHSLTLEVKAKEYYRNFEIRYVLLSWNIEQKMFAKENENIVVYLLPSDLFKLNDSAANCKNFFNIPKNNIAVYGIRKNNEWRSFNLTNDLVLDILFFLEITILIAGAIFFKQGVLLKEWNVGILILCFNVIFIIAIYILEAFVFSNS